MHVPCPHCGEPVDPAALLGSITTRAKRRAAKANGKLGGRPKGAKDKKPRRSSDANALAHSVAADAERLTQQGPGLAPLSPAAPQGR
jgi:hypothetical protein